MFQAALIVTALTYVVYFVVWRIRHVRYWRRKGVDGPPSVPFLGNIMEVGDPNKPWALRMPELTKQFGKVWGYQEGVENALVVADLDAALDVLSRHFEDFPERNNPNPVFKKTDNASPRVHLAQAWGFRWKRLRSIVSPQFSVANLKRILPTVEDSALQMVGHLEKHSADEAVDIHHFYQEYTMDVIARIAMGQDGSRQWDSDYTHILRQIFERDPRDPVFLLATVFPVLQPALRELFISFSKVVRMPVSKLFEQIEAAVKERKEERARSDVEGKETGGMKKEKRLTDFIDLFLDAEAEVDLKAEGALNPQEMQVRRQLTTEEVIAQCFIFLLAGFDTTANSLSYVSHFIALRPDIREKLQEEVDQVCTDEHVSYEQLGELKYMDCVVKEALRVHPLGTVAVSRVAHKDCEVAGVPIEKGTVVQVDAYSLQKSEEIWGDDAKEFVPERWMSLTKEQSNAYLSFGAGPRMCVGVRLAYAEEKMALVHVLRNFDVVSGPLTEPELKLFGALTISPASVTVYMKPRKK